MTETRVSMSPEEFDRLRECERECKELQKRIAEVETARGHYVHKEVRILPLQMSAAEELEFANKIQFEIMSDEEVLAEARLELERTKVAMAALVSAFKRRGEVIKELEGRSLWQRIINKRSALADVPLTNDLANIKED